MSALRRNPRTGKIVIRRPSISQTALNLVIIALLAATLYGFATIDTKGTDMAQATADTFSYLGEMFSSPQAAPERYGVRDGSDLETFVKVLEQLGITLALAFLTTLFGGVVAIVLGLLAARNLTNERVSNVIKGFIAVVRAVPTVLWVLIFAIGSGLGAVAAVIGMSFHTVGYLMKAYSESFEELDAGVIEALRASGATWTQIVFQAVLPSSATYLLSWTFIRFEINFAVAVTMGAAAGAGGIGFNLLLAANRFIDWQEVGYLTYMILAIALLMELVATRIKDKLHIHD